MSQMEYDALQQPAQQSNGLAIAGFVCSLVGLFTGILSPVGLILSLVALGRPNGRGWAIAGIILGVLGMCGWLIAFLIAGAGMLAALGIGAAAVAFALSEPEKIELTADALALTVAIEAHHDATGALPATLDELGLEQGLLSDPWGNPYRYILLPDRAGYEILTNGQDGQPGTDDDRNVRDFHEVWQADTPASATQPDEGEED